MLKIGDYVALKSDLVLGKKYGTVIFSKYHTPYLYKLLKVYKVSSTGTAYCSYNCNPCKGTTFSEPMLNIAKFNINDTVRIIHSTRGDRSQYLNTITTIKSVEYENEIFTYRLNCDNGFYEWNEFTLEYSKEDLKPILKNENQLQREDFNLRSGERVQGSRVHGRKSQASIRSRPLRDPSRIRGK